MSLAKDLTMPRGCAPIGGALIALMLAGAPQAAHAACAGAQGALETLICNSTSLSGAWSEIETETAAIQAAHPDLAPLLAQDQTLFTTLLDKTLKDLMAEHPAAEVPAIMMTGLQDRLAFLHAIDPAAEAGLAGSWQNAAGSLRVSVEAAGQMAFQLSVFEPIMGLNTCGVEGAGRESAQLLSIALPPSDEVSLTGIGEGLLGVDYTRAGRMAQGPVQCTDSPPVSGVYFRIKEGA